ncbi:MAG: glycosyltransferase family 4 protein [Bacteroidota bacterium]|jgi:glycosyltransferase involved in cell wall biosynthesis|nr:glycosyltransferase family 4 protein [Bacteroidota bacterium]
MNIAKDFTGASSTSKLLIISSEFPPGPGGIGNHAYNLAKYLQQIEGLEITVLTDTNFTSNNELKDFDNKNDFKIFRIFRVNPIILTYIRRIVLAGKLISKHDKIIFSGKFSLWLAGIYKPLFGKKEFIAVVHGSELDLPNPRIKRFTHNSLNQCNKIISVSRYTQNFLPIHKNGQQRIIIANGIDVSEANTDHKNYTTAVKTKALTLLTVGNVTPRKGQKNIIRALPEIRKSFPEIHYHIVGLPTHKEALIEFAQKLGVLSNITFYGKLPRKELLNMYKQCDIFMMLSDHTADGDFEGFGIAVLEANLWRKPAIGSRNSGIADAIDDGVTGILVDQQNDKEIAQAVSGIYNNYESYSQKAYQWSLLHDWEKIVRQYYKAIYEY